eukprot:TRINITY_DN8900_c0_g1_i1.p1 TRINITY_DN8900_c0_g1~~TRINITY_DN8900_c0_g1_i1.p1  ORF type:complete len:426 (-),score=43.91 TRINITY_DN8900_c0_g1_i1:72-1328(-)
MPGPASLRKICSLAGHDERVWHVAWRPNAKMPMLASCGSDLTIRIWGTCGPRASAIGEADAWGQVAEIDASERHTRTLRSLSWSPDGSTLAVTSFDATTSLWRQVTTDSGPVAFECISVLSGHENEVKSAAFSPSGALFATCSRDRSVWVYDAEDTDEYECVALLQSHTQDVKCVKWHPEQDVLFSCSYDDTIKVWGPDGDDWCCKETLEGHESTVWSLSFDGRGSRFVTCSDDKTLRIWAPKNSLPEASRKGADGYPAKTESGTNRFQSSVAIASFVSPLFRGGLAGVRPSPEADSKASSHHPRPEWSVPADASCGWSCASVIKGEHTRPVYSVDWLAFETKSAPTDSIASACGDNRVRIFQPKDAADLSMWTCIANEEAHDGDVNCVAWCRSASRDKPILATAGDDGLVNIWEFGN